ncbi:Gfo/Idh/MocA family protein [Shewanella waksmanii]|uniref:Gfo/Idh/MocA family protein n=1 Tax=Shewanella waksmanii TaxID=213783 RepID=UPI003736F051
MTDKLTIALVGLGDIAQKAYLPVLANHPLVEPILCTRNPQVLAQLQRQYRITQGHSNLDSLLAIKPDAVMIHSATASHFALAQACLEANIATFVDKPLCDNAEQCQRLVDTAKQHNTLLYVGFNRRFAPLIAPLGTAENQHVIWQKNRVALAAEPRQFIFDDFIHLVDGLRFLAQLSPQQIPTSLQVNSQMSQGKLQRIHVQFTHQNRLFEASMNRQSGVTEEQLLVYRNHEKIQIDNLMSGQHYQAEQCRKLGFNDWTSYLHSRGFEHMIAHWLDHARRPQIDWQQLEDQLASHLMCEQILQQIN